MVKSDPTARIAKGAQIGDDAEIGPYCVIGADAVIGERVRLISHVHVSGRTSIGPRTIVYPFASLGSPPQSVNYRGGPTRLVIGADCDIRESVTMNIGTEDGGGLTEIGDRCFVMAGAHVAHDCKVGHSVTFANNVALGGHVEVGDHAVFGGQSAVRQHVRIGEGAMVVGLSGVRADVIPWGMVQGPLAKLVGLNAVGLKRHGHAAPEILKLRAAYEDLFFGGEIFRERVEKLSAQSTSGLVAHMVAFIRAGTRPLTMAVRRAESGEDEA